MTRSAPRGSAGAASAGPHYDDAHRLHFRRRGGFARWYGAHGRTGEFVQLERRRRLVEALAATHFSFNAAAKLLGCSWHTVDSDFRAIFYDGLRQPSDRRRRWLERDLKILDVIDLRDCGFSFREISKRTGVPLATCHRWWHCETAVNGHAVQRSIAGRPF